MLTIILFIAFALTGVAANALVAHLGVVPVWPGMYAPAGVYVVGLALTLRDALHERAGARLAVAAILAGSAISYSFSPGLAIASGAAFLLSELADLAVYAPLRRRSLTLALAASNVVGLVVDSLLFLILAFQSLEYLPGQVVGKLIGSAAAIAAITARRRGLLDRRA